MKFPYSMLLDFVQTSLTAEQTGDLLTMAGFELEDISVVGDEPVLDVKVMSNRGDGLSMLGLAREILAKDCSAQPTDLYSRSAKHFSDVSFGTSSAEVTVRIETSDCSRYACCVFRDLENGSAPDWLKRRLEQAGQRSISLLVDVANYVMLELGQPLHTFDLDRLQGREVVVRKAREGEEITTLDGRKHKLDADEMMICDARGPVAVAGVMGGEATEVSSQTKNVLLESAHFESKSVRRTRKKLGLNTDASYRFERSVDPEGVVGAIRRFAELLGQEGSEILDEYPVRVRRGPISLRIDRAEMLLGMSISDEQAEDYLRRLGMEVAGHGDPFYVIPATWRPDLVREEDLIEELGRVHGYEQIPELLPSGVSTLGAVRGELQEIDRLRDSALRHGYTQIISHSLQDRHSLEDWGGRVGPRVVSSPEYALLRNSLLPGLADAMRRNGAKNLHLFEIGRTFSVAEERFSEKRHIGYMASGEIVPSFRKGESVPSVSFYSLKGDVLDCVQELGRVAKLRKPGEADARFHPTRQAQVMVGSVCCGVLGQIHPSVAEELRLEPETYASELDLEELLSICPEPLKLKPISRNPAVRRDIAILVDKNKPFAEIEKAVLRGGGDLLEDFWVFDDFEGASIPQGMHSIGLALQLRKMGENFTDAEANQVRDAVVEELVKLGGTVR